MSTDIPNAHKRSRQDAQSRERFEPTTEPRPLTSDDLDECSQPGHDVTDAPAGQRAVFAVAVRRGILHAETPGRDLDMPHLSIVYLTADGEQALAKRVAAGNGLALVNRALVVDDRELQPTPDHARRWAPIVQRHPEAR